jgi:hypothetical protein
VSRAESSIIIDFEPGTVAHHDVIQFIAYPLTQRM